MRRMNVEVRRAERDDVERRCYGGDPLAIPFARRAKGYFYARDWRESARRTSDEAAQLRAGVPYTRVVLINSAERIGATRGETLRRRLELDYYEDPTRLPFGSPSPLPL